MAGELNQEIYKAVLDSLPSGVYVVDRNRQILLWSAGAEKLTGYSRQLVVGRRCDDDILIHTDENDTELCGSACPLVETMHDGQPREAHLYLLHKDGQRVPVTIRSVAVRDEDGTIVGAAEIFERRSLLSAVTAYANDCGSTCSLDVATGLPDHNAMRRSVELSLEHFVTFGAPFGVLAIAIDKLDLLRSEDGCKAVGAVVLAAANTIAQNVRDEDVVGRWSGERFLAVMADATTSALQSSAQILERLVSRAAIPWWGDRMSVTVSVGGAIVRAGDTVDAIIHRSEKALADSLSEHGGGVVVV